jgi:hypothetical protein
MAGPTSAEASLAKSIIDQVDQLVHEAEQAQKPLELDPYRSRLFELFVTAEAADLVKESGGDDESREKSDLAADSLCRILGERWNLADATRESFTHQTRLPPQHLSRMRMLWSLMRMWMEWSYAWRRWPEFHQDTRLG